MLIESIARRYAIALLDTATAQKSLDTIGHELNGFVETLQKESRLRDLWFSARLPGGEKKDLIRRSFPEFSSLLFNFLSVLVDKRRENLIEKGALEYEKLLRIFYNQAIAEVRVATAMPESIEAELKQQLSKQLGKRVELSITLDPSLLGGMVLQIGDRIFDGSIRAKLEALHEDLLNVSLAGASGDTSH